MSPFGLTGKKATVLFFLGLLIVLPLTPVHAATLLTREEATRNARIETLLTEIKRLQALLQERRAAEATPQVYESKFFDFDFDAVYRVTPLGLTRIDAPALPARKTDIQLYELLAAIIGKDYVYQYLADFRVYTDPDADTSAFVETMSKSDKWLMGVNAADFSTRDRAIRDSFIDLFLHEYAHLLLLEEKATVEDFRNTFWTSADLRHAARVEDAAQRFDRMEEYFEKNKSRFVSDYATMNPDEDMAETFVQFVITDMPPATSIRNQKIRFFYQSPTLTTERLRLRENLRLLRVIR